MLRCKAFTTTWHPSHSCRRELRCRVGSPDFSKFASQKYLDEAAKRFALGLDKGIDEDDLLALELGASSLDGLSETQRKYGLKVKQKLLQRGDELRREEQARREREAKYFELGKKAYERGQYDDSVKFLERSVDDLGANTTLGGEAQLWLALAYAAVGREEACIELYKALEDGHPVSKVKKQAADLRFIMEAPKLTLSEDERVKIPLLQAEERRREERRAFTPRPQPKAKGEAVESSSYWDRAKWELPAIPMPPTDKWYYRVAWLVLLVGVTVYVNWQLAKPPTG